MELMMALAVIGVIAAFTIPSFNEFRLNNRMTGAANDLLAALNVARSEAIKRQQPVAFCGSLAPDATPPVCNNTLSGWVVWVDNDNDRTIGAGEQVVATHAPLSTALNATINFDVITYGATGFVQNFGPATRGILLCDERQDAVVGDQFRKRIVSLSATGRPAIVRTGTALGDLPTPQPPMDPNWMC